MEDINNFEDKNSKFDNKSNNDFFSTVSDETIRKIDIILSRMGVDPSARVGHDDYSFVNTRQLEEDFHDLFDSIDWELKQDVKLNNKINETEELKKDLLFNIEDNFMCMNSKGEKVFDEVGFQNARKFLDEWQVDKAVILIELRKQRAKAKNIFNFVARSKVQQLSSQLESNDRRYKDILDLFTNDARIKRYDRDEMVSLKDENEKEIEASIKSVIDKHLSESLNKNPEMILFEKVLGKTYNIYSTSFLSNKNNQNLS